MGVLKEKNRKVKKCKTIILEVLIDSLLAKKKCCYGCRGDIWQDRLKVRQQQQNDQALQTKYRATKHYKQQQTANAESINNLKRRWNTSC